MKLQHCPTLKTRGVSKIYNGGDPQNCVGIAFIAEGYKADEIIKFREDVKKMIEFYVK